MNIQSIRQSLGIVVLIAVMVGCSGEPKPDESPPDPVTLSSPRQCDVCGMVIEEHHGPSGQVFYRENGDDPVTFDSLKHGLLPHYSQRKKRGREVLAVYVTDYSRVDTGVTIVNGDPYVRRTVEPESFARADEVIFVVGSSVRGAMGKDYIPFSNRKDARQFADNYGGELLTFEEIQNRTNITDSNR